VWTIARDSACGEALGLRASMPVSIAAPFAAKVDVRLIDLQPTYDTLPSTVCPLATADGHGSPREVRVASERGLATFRRQAGRCAELLIGSRVARRNGRGCRRAVRFCSLAVLKRMKQLQVCSGVGISHSRSDRVRSRAGEGDVSLSAAFHRAAMPARLVAIPDG